MAMLSLLMTTTMMMRMQAEVGSGIERFSAPLTSSLEMADVKVDVKDKVEGETEEIRPTAVRRFSKVS